MSLKNILGCSVISAALIVFGYFYLDARLAEFVSEEFGSGFLLSQQVSNLPDLLFLLVVTVTVVSWTGRLYLAAKHVNGPFLNFLENIGLAVPVAFICKHFLKQLFGRLNTRLWLLHPDGFGFHWFQGGGDFSSFPSGHMAVFTALMLGIGRYIPLLRPVCGALLFVLAAALIVTGYHFFSDIAAGFYLGFIIDFMTRRGLECFRSVSGELRIMNRSGAQRTVSRKSKRR
jgi:membrane-associated phospholipid phosphatase